MFFPVSSGVYAYVVDEGFGEAAELGGGAEPICHELVPACWAIGEAKAGYVPHVCTEWCHEGRKLSGFTFGVQYAMVEGLRVVKHAEVLGSGHLVDQLP